MAQEGYSASTSSSSHELNQMIEFWSKRGNVDDQSRNIAQDLLKSALKLQESLVMLSRLQEASKVMGKSKNNIAKSSNHREECGKSNFGTSDAVSGFDASSYRSMSQLSYRKVSIDGPSSTNSFRDFNNVLRDDGLSRQISSSGREYSFRDVPAREEKIGSGRFENFSSVKRPENKLVTIYDDGSARNCMEEIKKVIKDSLVNQSLLSVSSDEDQKFSSCTRQCDVHSEVQSSSSCTSPSDPPESQLKVDPPMKASRPTNLIARLMGLEEFPAKIVQPTPKESEIKKSYHLRKPVFDIQMPKMINSPIDDRVGKQGRKELKDIIESMRYKGLLRSSPSRDYSLTTASWNATEELPPIVVIKPLPTTVYEGKGKVGGNFLADSVVSEIKDHGIRHEESGSVTSEMQTVRAGTKNSMKSKTLAHDIADQQRPNSNAWKIDRTYNESREGKKLIENHNRKTNQVISTTIKASVRHSKKPEIPPIQKKSQANKSISTRQIDLLPSRQCTREISVGQAPRKVTNNGTIQRSSSAVKAVEKKKVKKEDAKRCDMTKQGKNQIISERMDMVSKEPAKVCNDSEEECPRKTGTDGMFGVSLTTKAENICEDEKVIFTVSTYTREKKLLLSSPMFLDKVEGLFNLQIEMRSLFLSSNIMYKDDKDDILLLDCANELLERKSSQILLSSHPLLQTPLKCKCKIALDALLDEVIEGIASWRWCEESVDTNSSQTDKLYLILEKDLMSNSMVLNGVWDIGWLCGLSVEEAEVVVNEIEMDIEDELIEEIVRSLAHNSLMFAYMNDEN